MTIEWTIVDNLSHLKRLNPESHHDRKARSSTSVRRKGPYRSTSPSNLCEEDKIRLTYLAQRCMESESDNHRMAGLVEEAIAEREKLEEQLRMSEEEKKALVQKLRLLERLRTNIDASQSKKQTLYQHNEETSGPRDSITPPEDKLKETVFRLLGLTSAHTVILNPIQPRNSESQRTRTVPSTQPSRSQQDQIEAKVQLHRDPHLSPSNYEESEVSQVDDFIGVEGVSPDQLLISSPPQGPMFGCPLSPINESEPLKFPAEEPNDASAMFFHLPGQSDASPAKSTVSSRLSVPSFTHVRVNASFRSPSPSQLSQRSPGLSPRRSRGASESSFHVKGVSEWSEEHRTDNFSDLFDIVMEESGAQSDNMESRGNRNTSPEERRVHVGTNVSVDFSDGKSLAEELNASRRKPLSPGRSLGSRPKRERTLDRLQGQGGSLLFENDTSMIASLRDILTDIGSDGISVSSVSRAFDSRPSPVLFISTPTSACEPDFDEVIRAINLI
ncbi:hypothetical protein HDU67_006110 [Dinochytrium kinnereticum]|nr:hypothetical protein HDU67_006110 [Dinochytrium kinnereticum]